MNQLLLCSRYRSSDTSFFSTASSLLPLRLMTSSATENNNNDNNNNSDQREQPEAPSSFFWHARQDCWRPHVRDVENISWGLPAKKKKGTGSRGIPHRLNQEERLAFDQARRHGFLQVTGSAWRSQRRDAPLLNSYRSLMDARGRPMIVLHKMNPNNPSSVISMSDSSDRLVVDLSPLRLPLEFGRIEMELKDRLMVEFNIDSQHIDSDDDDAEDIVEESATGEKLDDDGWETRPIYQLPPHSLSWNVSRQQGKLMGKYLGNLFENIEEVSTSRKPQGVKPGKGRRHGGYGIG